MRLMTLLLPSPNPATRRLQALGGSLLLVIILLVVVIYDGHRQAGYSTAYLAAAGEMRMLSQRLAKASGLATQGHAAAFRQLGDSRDRFAARLAALNDGGEIDGVRVPPSPAVTKTALKALNEEWQRTARDAAQLLDSETRLVALGSEVATINNSNPQLLQFAEELAALRLQQGGSAREIAAANQLVMLTQRIAKNASALLVGDHIEPEVAFLLGKDSNSFRQLLSAFREGDEVLGIPAVRDEPSRNKLAGLSAAYAQYHEAVSSMLGSMRGLVLAKQAGSRIFSDSDQLQASTDRLAVAYQEDGSDGLFGPLLGFLALVAFLLLGWMARTYLDDARLRAEEAEASQRESEHINRHTQDAILRLMNELGDLANGDLTVSATVSEEITGAIADSVNYAIEELRVLVGQIDTAADRLGAASETARHTSSELLVAAGRQAGEIECVGLAALDMVLALSAVSTEARQSAKVARQSLAAADKGGEAFLDAIQGMSRIHHEMQETARRIRRLGESSQEIGEIVGMISGLSEQTNMLAVNAAIQAAAAGEAGRGFSIVAEEVQGLAERSAEATRRVSVIVGTIQADTQEAVAAMGASTLGVGEGARRLDAAGQALSEIGDVSQNLAQLVENIASATQRHAEAATRMADQMQEILRITRQTSAGTRQTAGAIGELTELASDLKASVAGFKVGSEPTQKREELLV